jgi:hypothetical protein
MAYLCRHREETEALLQPIYNLEARRGRVVSTMPQPFYPRRNPAPIVQEAGWAYGLVWTETCPHQDMKSE